MIYKKRLATKTCKNDYMSNDIGVIILAAGIGKRMHSEIPKVLHRMCGKEMLWYVMKTGCSLAPSKCVVVIGKSCQKLLQFATNDLKQSVALDKKTRAKRNRGSQIITGEFQYIIQDPPLGTGDAVNKTGACFFADTTRLSSCRSNKNLLVKNILVLCGDVPLLNSETLKELLKFHLSSKATATILSSDVPDPSMYGRIVRKNNKVVKIVEDKDASAVEKAIKEINSGIYVFSAKELFSALSQIKPTNAQREYYLTDTIEILTKKGHPVYAFKTNNYREILGINTRKAFSELEEILQETITDGHMINGVTIHLPRTVKIDYGVSIGIDTIIHPGVQLLGSTEIGEKCEIGAGAKIVDSKISSGTKVGEFTNIEKSFI